MTKLWFGGSFNPIHVGHLLVARAIAESGGFDRVVLIPSAQPPHKPGTADLADARHRLGMCQAVTRHDPLFEVDDLELRRTGPSYSIDTIRELKQGGDGAISWLIGADMLQILPQWHRAEELLGEVEFVIAQRPGYAVDWAALPHAFQSLRPKVVTAPLLEISASDIRRRVREGQSIRYLVPPEVERYIFSHKLYGA
jgi:nicotinate-nucleotide adenylyltransferase